jgi:hypothetical protein
MGGSESENTGGEDFLVAILKAVAVDFPVPFSSFEVKKRLFIKGF